MFAKYFYSTDFLALILSIFILRGGVRQSLGIAEANGPDEAVLYDRRENRSLLD
jgi:hypothetical protein